MTRETKTDRLALEARKAYRATDLYKVELLLIQESRWRRKETIARNKLETIQHVIRETLREMATPKGGSSEA